MNTGEINKQKVRDFFRFIEEGSADKVADLFHKDGIHLNPYASGLFPERVEGRQAIKEYWLGPIENFEKVKKQLHQKGEESQPCFCL